MVRFIFLETIAGVPGIVAGTLRHLHSIRRFKPDQGWIKTLLEESYNERMHLLTFLEMYKPGWLMRFMVWAAQGTFYNAMFIAYLICPRVCHRFVGYLEEEAVHTYTRCIQEMDRGLLPRWTDPNFRIPEIAVKYWNMPEGRRTMRDLILYIRVGSASPPSGYFSDGYLGGRSISPRCEPYARQLGPNLGSKPVHRQPFSG